MIDESVRSRFTEHLEPSESVLWTGRPAQGIAFQSADAWLVPLTFVWFAGAVSASGIFVADASLGMVLFGLGAMLIGSYLTFGRFWLDAHLRSQTLYAITDQRVLVIGGITGKNLVAFAFPKAGDVSVTQARNSRATIKFNSEPGYPAELHTTYWRNQEFFRVLDAQNAAALLRRAGA